MSKPARDAPIPANAVFPCHTADPHDGSAELWEFNPSTSVWTEVLVTIDGDSPSARDGHTASVAGSKMIVFGGRGNQSDSDAQAGRGSNTALLGDEWEIDLDPSQLITTSTNFSTVGTYNNCFCFFRREPRLMYDAGWDASASLLHTSKNSPARQFGRHLHRASWFTSASTLTRLPSVKPMMYSFSPRCH